MPISILPEEIAHLSSKEWAEENKHFKKTVRHAVIDTRHGHIKVISTDCPTFECSAKNSTYVALTVNRDDATDIIRHEFLTSKELIRLVNETINHQNKGL